MTLEERFWDKVDAGGSSECWEWTGWQREGGYGAISDGGNGRQAHRVSYEIEHGEVPDDLNVLHRCDNPPCVNPAHLFVGTHGDNMRDAWSKGRRTARKGEEAPNRKLTREDVEEIKALLNDGTLSQTSIAESYGVTPAHITHIKNGEAWGHIEVES